MALGYGCVFFAPPPLEVGRKGGEGGGDTGLGPYGILYQLRQPGRLDPYGVIHYQLRQPGRLDQYGVIHCQHGKWNLLCTHAHTNNAWMKS